MLFGFTFSRDFLLGVPLVMLAILLYGGACDPCLDRAANGSMAPAIAPSDLTKQNAPLLDDDDDDSDSAATPR